MLANHSKSVALGKTRYNENNVNNLVGGLRHGHKQRSSWTPPPSPQKQISVGFLLDCLTACLYGVYESE